MITSRSSLQTPKQTSGWKLCKVVSFETNIFSSDTAKIRTTNCTEYIEADDNKDLIKNEEDRASVGSSGKSQEKLKLRL